MAFYSFTMKHSLLNSTNDWDVYLLKSYPFIAAELVFFQNNNNNFANIYYAKILSHGLCNTLQVSILLLLQVSIFFQKTKLRDTIFLKKNEQTQKLKWSVTNTTYMLTIYKYNHHFIKRQKSQMEELKYHRSDYTHRVWCHRPSAESNVLGKPEGFGGILDCVWE